MIRETAKATAIPELSPCDRCGKLIPTVSFGTCVFKVTCDACCAAATQTNAVEAFRSHLSRSGLPEELWTYDRSLAPHPELLDWCVAHAESWIWLGGPTGTGKTRALARAAVVHIWNNPRPRPTLQWVESALWCETMKGRDIDAKRRQAQLLEQAKRADILVLDDFGQESLDDRSRALIFGLVDHRYTRQLRTWFTTNAGKGDLESRIGVTRWPQIRRRIHERGWFHNWDGYEWKTDGAYGLDQTDKRWWDDL